MVINPVRNPASFSVLPGGQPLSEMMGFLLRAVSTWYDRKPGWIMKLVGLD